MGKVTVSRCDNCTSIISCPENGRIFRGNVYMALDPNNATKEDPCIEFDEDSSKEVHLCIKCVLDLLRIKA